MKKEISVLVIFMALILVANVAALDTPIKVLAPPNMEITVRVMNIDGSETLEGGSFIDQLSGDDGIVEIVFSSEAPESNKIDISIMRRKNGILQKYSDGTSVRKLDNDGEHIKTGWPVEIDATVDPPILLKAGRPAEPVVEETGVEGEEVEVVEETGVEGEEVEVVEENIETEEIIEDTEEAQITGLAVTGKIGNVFTSTKTYYILGGLILLIVIIIFARKKINKKGNFTVTKMSDIQKNKEKVRDTDEELEDAEEKLREAKEELDDIKNRKSKLKEAQARLEKDKEELRKLESDEE